MPSQIFLHGGGDSPAARSETFGRFAAAASPDNTRRLTLVVAEADEAHLNESWEAYGDIFTAAGLAQELLLPLFVTPDRPLTYEMVAAARPAGIFVCGGATPVYHRAVTVERSWTAYLEETNVPYGGTSAGAAIASARAILGGWQGVRQGQVREILFRGAGEGLDPLTVRDGLGLVPFAVDVHASQMGTLTRLIHAVESGLVGGGWAIDENTMLVVDGDSMQIYGQGHCYHVWGDRPGAASVTIHIGPGIVAQ